MTSPVANLDDYASRKADAFMPEDRRALDRSLPAFLEDGNGEWSVVTRRTDDDGNLIERREVFAHDKADALRIRAIHNLLGDFAPEQYGLAPIVGQVVHTLRDHPTDPLAGA